LAEEDQAAVLALPHVVHDYEVGQYVAREGDLPTYSCVVLSGFAVRHKIVAQGRRQILNLHVPGDMVDLQNSMLRVADHNVQMLTAARVALIPREAVVDLAFSRPEVGKTLWLETLIEGSISREWIANVGQRDSKSKVGHLLCEFAYRLNAVGLGEECNYELPMTQEQLADAVGLTSVHVNRTLKLLEAEDLIQRNRRSVVIRDWKRMAEVSDFRPTYLHLAAQPPGTRPRNGGA
jgi:CRP-like cAMP-binding protein